MAQAIRLCPLLGLLSGRVIPTIKWPVLRRSLHQQKHHHYNFHQYLLPQRCLSPAKTVNQTCATNNFQLFCTNIKSFRQPILVKSKNSNKFSTNGKSSSKNDLTQYENTRYWETFEAELKQLTLIQRYKKMAKEFWYVGIPVVGVTSALWLASFYLIAASGYVKPLVSKLRDYGVPETIAKALESEKMGPLAIAIIMYKLASPARYAVSIAGTVKAIKFLLKRGLIKPVPPKDKLKEIVMKKVSGKSKTP